MSRVRKWLQKSKPERMALQSEKVAPHSATISYTPYTPHAALEPLVLACRQCCDNQSAGLHIWAGQGFPDVMLACPSLALPAVGLAKGVLCSLQSRGCLTDRLEDGGA